MKNFGHVHDGAHINLQDGKDWILISVHPDDKPEVGEEIRIHEIPLRVTEIARLGWPSYLFVVTTESP